MITLKSLSTTLGLITALAAVSGSACSDKDEKTTAKDTLSAAMEVPAPVGAEAATGEFAYDLDESESELHYTLAVFNLTGPATAAHLHKAPPGVAGPVAVPLVTPDTGASAGRVTLTAEQIADLKAGNLYVNVHTAMNPMGEIRAQVTPRK